MDEGRQVLTLDKRAAVAAWFAASSRWRRTNWLAEAGWPIPRRLANQALDTAVLCLRAADGSGASLFATIGAFDGSNQFLTFAPGFAASPVPEPSTYAALLGLAAPGFVWQRRRQSVRK